MFLLTILLFFWSEKKSETTKIFDSTASPQNRNDDFNFESNKQNENKFQASRDFSNQNQETFHPMFSESYNSFTQENSKFTDEQEFYQPTPRQYFFTPYNEYTPTESYPRDEL